MRGVQAIVGYALRETVRRKIFVIVLLLTAAFLALYWLGVSKVFESLEEFGDPEVPVDEDVLAGATLFGLSMFATLFLGTVLAVFLTLSAVRGDAERGFLQPLLVRPISRGALLGARFLAAAAVCTVYVLAVYAAALLITAGVGGWRPERIAIPALELVGAVVIIAALSLLGSVFLSPTANGVAVLMVFGAGLVAGLLGQIGEALESDTLQEVARTVSWAVPFEALYQDALSAIAAEAVGLTGVVVQLGPFGGAQAAGPLLAPWVIGYLALVGAAALVGFSRRDL